MEQIPLADAIEGLRDEFARAVQEARGKSVQFPVGEVTLEFQVGVTKTAEGRTGIRAWVVELGGSISAASESVQKVTVVLNPPVNLEGVPIKVVGGSDVEYQ